MRLTNHFLYESQIPKNTTEYNISEKIKTTFKWIRFSREKIKTTFKWIWFSRRDFVTAVINHSTNYKKQKQLYTPSHYRPSNNWLLIVWGCTNYKCTRFKRHFLTLTFYWRLTMNLYKHEKRSKHVLINDQ